MNFTNNNSKHILKIQMKEKIQFLKCQKNKIKTKYFYSYEVSLIQTHTQT